MSGHLCRACHGQAGQLVLDLGRQPACDYFPRSDDPGPDPVYALQMWLCASCGLAQLLSDPTVPEEPRGLEPAALVAQATDAVGRVSAAGLLPPGAHVAEYGSPHGGSWLPLLTDRGLVPVESAAPADVIVDCFGLMHEADQRAALRERAARLAPGGVLLLQYHSLGTIVRCGQWNALRHGHYAYYSATALTAMLGAAGLSPHTAWQFDLYGGTVLIAAKRSHADAGAPDDVVRSLLADETACGIDDPAAFVPLQDQVLTGAAQLRELVAGRRASGHRVLGYGAASRAVALLRVSGVDRDLLPAIADASPAKQGLRLPGTMIPIISPEELIAQAPHDVLVFVPDLIQEIRAAYPQVEAAGGRWIAAETI
ncbi:MAG TPA: methyltransferase C-terminal domain-containing protein [Trebonia sp.]|nr:methyltransferase C-terminal domain-containing protein [Trebonia sp.]